MSRYLQKNHVNLSNFIVFYRIFQKFMEFARTDVARPAHRTPPERWSCRTRIPGRQPHRPKALPEPGACDSRLPRAGKPARRSMRRASPMSGREPQYTRTPERAPHRKCGQMRGQTRPMRGCREPLAGSANPPPPVGMIPAVAPHLTPLDGGIGFGRDRSRPVPVFLFFNRAKPPSFRRKPESILTFHQAERPRLRRCATPERGICAEGMTARGRFHQRMKMDSVELSFIGVVEKVGI